MYPETRLSGEFGDGSPIGWQAGKGEAIQDFESELDLSSIPTSFCIRGAFRTAFRSTAPLDTELLNFANAIPAVGSCDESVT